MGELRDKCRSAILDAGKNFAKKIVNVNGVDIEVRQPSVKQRSELIKGLKADASGNIVDGDSLMVLVKAAMFCCYVPGTSERVFDEADLECLLDLPCGNPIDDLGPVVLDLMNVDAEAKAKNSKRTKKGN